MLSQDRLRKLLRPYGVELDSLAMEQLSVYLRLLMHWNEKINLTAIHSPEEAVTRHFGESLFLSRCEELRWRLLDVGSGAGFPGLALKLTFPDLEVTLLEPVAKKRAFLKEVARSCHFTSVDVRPERLEEFAGLGRRFEAVTARAVGGLEPLVSASCSMLSESGKVWLWLSRPQAEKLRVQPLGMRWEQELDVPLSRERVILIGSRT